MTDLEEMGKLGFNYGYAFYWVYIQVDSIEYRRFDYLYTTAENLCFLDFIMCIPASILVGY
jgi:hypothetical protein